MHAQYVPSIHSAEAIKMIYSDRRRGVSASAPRTQFDGKTMASIEQPRKAFPESSAAHSVHSVGQPLLSLPLPPEKWKKFKLESTYVCK